jgi:hypothetical protein
MGICSSAPSAPSLDADGGKGYGVVPFKRQSTLDLILATAAQPPPDNGEACIDLDNSVVQTHLAKCNGSAFVHNSGASTPDTLRRMCSLLKLITTSHQHQLEQLTLSMIPADGEVIHALSELVAANVPRLAILRVEVTAMQAQNVALWARPLCLALKHSSYLQELDLRGCILGQSQGCILTDFFGRNESGVTRLGLARTNLGAGELAGMIGLNHSITWLDLSSNRLGDVVMHTANRRTPALDR